MIDFTIKGHCPEGCHECCSNILTVSDKEISIIKNYITLHGIRPINPNSVFSTYVDRCPFVNQAGMCAIYEVRPEICGYFVCNRTQEYRPFNHANKKVVNMVTTFLPDAFMPPDAPDVKKLNKFYQEKKEKAGFK